MTAITAPTGSLFSIPGIVSGYEAAPVIPMASLNYHWDNITFQIMPGIEYNEPVGAVIAVNLTLLKW